MNDIELIKLENPESYLHDLTLQQIFEQFFSEDV